MSALQCFELLTSKPLICSSSMLAHGVGVGVRARAPGPDLAVIRDPKAGVVEPFAEQHNPQR